MIRSFIAVELPDMIREEIAKVQSVLKRAGGDVRWVRPESVHLTLKFLGDVEEDAVEPLIEAAARAVAPHPVLDLSLKGIGVFPDRRKLRVVWLGLDGDIESLKLLQKDVEKAAAEFGFDPEKRPFRPHLTLGRVKSGRNRVDLLDQIDTIQPRIIEFTVRDLVYFKSVLKPSGAEYTVLGRLPLTSL